MLTYKMHVWPRKGQFQKAVDQMQGNIFLVLPDQTVVNVKEAGDTVRLLDSISPSSTEMKVLCDQPRDLSRFIEITM